MNSLEFIRKKISKKIKIINEKRNFMINCKNMNIPFNPEITYEDQKELEYLRQIECELEAWYVLKPDLEHTENELGENEIKLKVFYTDAKVEKDDTREKYYTLKKALEVKDNDR